MKVNVQTKKSSNKLQTNVVLESNSVIIVYACSRLNGCDYDRERERMRDRCFLFVMRSGLNNCKVDSSTVPAAVMCGVWDPSDRSSCEINNTVVSKK